MSAEPLYLVVDNGNPVTTFTDQDDLKAYLRRRRGTFVRPLVYRIDGNGIATIMTLSRAMGRGLDVKAPSRSMSS
jgi:hypothetical protein